MKNKRIATNLSEEDRRHSFSASVNKDMKKVEKELQQAKYDIVRLEAKHATLREMYLRINDPYLKNTVKYN